MPIKKENKDKYPNEEAQKILDGAKDGFEKSTVTMDEAIRAFRPKGVETIIFDEADTALLMFARWELVDIINMRIEQKKADLFEEMERDFWNSIVRGMVIQIDKKIMGMIK